LLNNVVGYFKNFSLFLIGQQGWRDFVSRQLCAGIFKQSMGARNRVGIGLSYWPASVYKFGLSFRRRQGEMTGNKYNAFFSLEDPSSKVIKFFFWEVHKIFY
jgi:hypothetical protein